MLRIPQFALQFAQFGAEVLKNGGTFLVDKEVTAGKKMEQNILVENGDHIIVK